MHFDYMLHERYSLLSTFVTPKAAESMTANSSLNLSHSMLPKPVMTAPVSLVCFKPVALGAVADWPHAIRKVRKRSFVLIRIGAQSTYRCA